MPEKNDDDYIKFVRINQEAQLSLTNRAMHLCSMHNGHAVKHAPPHICYCAKFGRSMSNIVGLHRAPQFYER